MGDNVMSINIGTDRIPIRLPCMWEHGISYGTPDRILEEHGISDKQVVIFIEKDFTRLEHLLSKLTGAPRLLRRPLDRLNSALWDLIDGNRPLSQIIQIMEYCYDEEIIPARQRCSESISQLIELNLVELK
tara:strand:+ start:11570 stop:11962 length:393 start_codon:yes stop_codon:yes gene_type:complete